jgi:adenylate cyclase
MSWPVRQFRFPFPVPLARERVWELVSNTDHFNRAIGLPAPDAGPVAEGDLSLAREVSTRIGPLPVRYREYPYEWVSGERFSVRRSCTAGPFAEYSFGMELTDGPPAPDGTPTTAVIVLFDVAPKNLIGWVSAGVAARGVCRGARAYLEEASRLQSAGKTWMLPKLATRVEINGPELDRLLGELAGRPVRAELIPLLREHLLTCDDEEAGALRPFVLAARWGADRDEVLRLWLHATTIGLLRLRWQLMCPVCRVAKDDRETLAHVTGEGHCDICGVDFTGNFDRYVELRFSTHPAVRAAEAAAYCIGAPSRSPHILVQQFLPAGGSAKIPHPGGGGLRLRVLRLNHMVAFQGSESPEEAPVTAVLGPEGWLHESLPAPSGRSVIRLSNQSDRDLLVVLEQTEWDPDAVTAARVTAMQEFRDMFSSEVLAPDQQVGIESVSLMFTDLAGSTALYEQVGDASAYGSVRRHFEFMLTWIGRNRGSIVKTIGDAVMAVFYTPEDAVRAALEIQSHVNEWNAGRPGEAPIVIKIGVHHGPAIAINSNDRLDYFGRTVNIAARVQRVSMGGDCVLTQECLHREGVRSLLAEFRSARETVRATLKGIEDEFELARVTPGRIGG